MASGGDAAQREAEKQRVQTRLAEMEADRARQANAQKEEELRQRRQRHREEKERVLERLAAKEAKDAEAKEAEERHKREEKEKHREERKAEKARLEERLSRMATAATPKTLFPPVPPEALPGGASPQPEPEPELEPTFLYQCLVLKTAALRNDFDMSSRQVGVLAVGEHVVILEERYNDLGQTRVRCSRGWSSLTTCDGTPLLKKVPTSTENHPMTSIANVAQATFASDKIGAGWDEAEALAKKLSEREGELSALRAQQHEQVERCDEALEQLSEEQKRLAVCEAERDELRQQLAVSAQDLSSIQVVRESEVADAALRVSQKDGELARAHAELQSAHQEIKTLASQVDFCRNELSAERDRRTEVMEQTAVLQKKLEAEQIAHRDADNMVKQLSQQKDLLSEAKQSADDMVKKLSQQKDLLGEQKRDDAAKHEAYVESTERQMQALRMELEESNANSASVAQKLDAAEARLSENTSELALLREKHVSCEQQRQATLEVLNSTDKERDEILVERQLFQTELNAARQQLEELKSQHQATCIDAELATTMIEKLTSQCESQKEQLAAAAAAEDAAAAVNEALAARLQQSSDTKPQVVTTETNSWTDEKVFAVILTAVNRTLQQHQLTQQVARSLSSTPLEEVRPTSAAPNWNDEQIDTMITAAVDKALRSSRQQQMQQDRQPTTTLSLSPLDEVQHTSSRSPRPHGVQQLIGQDTEKALAEAKLEVETLQDRLAAAERAGATYASEAQAAMQSNLATTSQELNVLDEMTQELAHVRSHHVERSMQVSATLQLLTSSEAEKTKAEEKAQELEAAIKSLQEELHHATATGDAAKEQVKALESSLVTESQRAQELEAAIKSLQEELHHATATGDAAKEQVKALEGTLVNESQRATQLAEQLGTTTERAEQQERLYTHVQQAYEKMKSDNDSLSEHLKTTRDQSRETESVLVTLRAELSAANAEREQERNRHLAVKAELTQAGDQLTGVRKLQEEAVAALEVELVAAREQLAASEAAGAEYAVQVTAYKEAAEKTRAELAELAVENEGLQREIATLADTERAAERAAQERCAALSARLSQVEAEAEAQVAKSNQQIARLQNEALEQEESRQNEIQQRIAATREEMLAEFEQRRAEERAQLAQIEGSELTKAEARLAFAEHTAAAAGSNGAAIQAQLSRSQAELLDANRLMARLKEQCEAWANENASHRARHQRKVFGLQAGLAGLNAGTLRLKSVRMAFLHWKRVWNLTGTSESLGLQLAVLHGQKGKFKAINRAFASWKTEWSASIQLQARTNRSVRGWQWRRTLATWQRWKLYLHLKANDGVFNSGLSWGSGCSSPKLHVSPQRVGTMVDKKLTDHALTLEQQLAEETARADLGTEIAEIERAARERIETERDATVASALERVAEAEEALVAERQRSGREFQGAKDGLQQQLNNVIEASSAEIEEAHAAARKTKAHAERRVVAAEKEAARCKEELREMQQEMAATRKTLGSGDPEKLKKDLRRTRNDAHKLRESLNVAEQANVLLEQQKAALEKRVRNLVKTTRTPRQRLRSGVPGDVERSPVGRGSSGSARSGSANRTGPLVLSPPPSQLLHPEKTHAWGKAPPTGRESPLKPRPRTASVGSHQGTHGHNYMPNPASLSKQSMTLGAPTVVLGTTTPGIVSRELGETPIKTPERPSRRAREPGRGGNRSTTQHDNVEAPSTQSLTLSVAQQEQDRLLLAAAQSKPHSPAGS